MFQKNGPTFVALIRQALASTRDGYDMLAPQFDLTPFRTPDAILKPAVAAIVASASASLSPFDSAIDLCCGTGAAMDILLPHISERLVGVDFSEGMLEIARANLKNEDYPCSVEFVEQNVMELTTVREYDLAVCFGALGHIPEAEEREFVRRVYRTLKPGGLFAFVTHYRPATITPRIAILKLFNGVMWMRNRLRKPEFIMYYLTFLLPDIETKLQDEGFITEVIEGLFEEPFQRGCLVIARKGV